LTLLGVRGGIVKGGGLLFARINCRRQESGLCVVAER
jgi:hypothetical protein